MCSDCRPKKILDGIWIAGSYEKPIITKLIKTYKYHFSLALAPILSDYLSLFLRNLLNKHRYGATDLFFGLDAKKLDRLKQCPRTILDFSSTLVLPVPLHKKRFNWRGFNQSEIIAKIIAQNFGLKINCENLTRLENKKAQANLGTKDRLDNLKNNFLWTGDYLARQNIILIDDVATTGSTLNECARALKTAGADEIWGLAIAKG